METVSIDVASGRSALAGTTAKKDGPSSLRACESVRPIHFVTALMAIYILYTIVQEPVTLSLLRVSPPSEAVLTACEQASDGVRTGGIDGLQSGDGVDVLEGPANRRARQYGQARPACLEDGARAKSFLMVFLGHSGSTAITSELAKHPHVYMEAKELVEKADVVYNETAALEKAEAFFERGLAAGKVPGFKIRPQHIMNRPEEWAALARKFDTRVIVQYRRNIVKQAVGQYSNRLLKDDSSVMGITKKEVATRCDTGVGCSYAIEDFDAFHSILKSMWKGTEVILRASDLLTDGRDCVFELRYEDYLYEREATLRDVQKFLGIPYAPTKSSFYKATGDNMCKVVINWQELCSQFFGCSAWRELFQDARNSCGCMTTSSPKRFCLV